MERLPNPSAPASLIHQGSGRMLRMRFFQDARSKYCSPKRSGCQIHEPAAVKFHHLCNTRRAQKTLSIGSLLGKGQNI
jgi:hypothetical protein